SVRGTVAQIRSNPASGPAAARLQDAGPLARRLRSVNGVPSMPFDTRDASRNKAAPLDLRLVAGNSNRPLAEAISGILKLPLAKSVVRRFADMEVFVEVQENMRGED